MFGLGMGELLVILAIALIFLGPKRLPDVASSLGKAIRSFRKATHDLTEQLEIDEEVKAPLRELQSALRDDPAPLKPLSVMQPPASTTPVSGAAAEPLKASDLKPVADKLAAVPELAVKDPKLATAVAASAPPADKKG
jgi:TatA/E family protein of Tat protein translocase